MVSLFSTTYFQSAKFTNFVASIITKLAMVSIFLSLYVFHCSIGQAVVNILFIYCKNIHLFAIINIICPKNLTLETHICLLHHLNHLNLNLKLNHLCHMLLADLFAIIENKYNFSPQCMYVYIKETTKMSLRGAKY